MTLGNSIYRGMKRATAGAALALATASFAYGGTPSVDLRMKDGFPQGNNAVLECVAEGYTPSTYDFLVKNSAGDAVASWTDHGYNNVFFSAPSTGTYDAECTGKTTQESRSDSLEFIIEEGVTPTPVVTNTPTPIVTPTPGTPIPSATPTAVSQTPTPTPEAYCTLDNFLQPGAYFTTVDFGWNITGSPEYNGDSIELYFENASDPSQTATYRLFDRGEGNTQIYLAEGEDLGVDAPGLRYFTSEDTVSTARTLLEPGYGATQGVIPICEEPKQVPANHSTETTTLALLALALGTFRLGSRRKE